MYTCIACRDLQGPLLLLYFHEGAPFGQHLDVTCVSSSTLGNLISEKEAEVERGQLVPRVKPDLFASCADEDEQQLLGFFHGKRSLCGEEARRPWG